MKNIRVVILFISGVLANLISIGQSVTDEETQFIIYGFGRTSFVRDDQDLSRSDLFVPANIKVNTIKTPNFFIGAKQSRFGFEVKQKLRSEILSIKLEGDFHNDASDAIGVFRMRQAYLSYKFLLVGMTWSNFYDDEANPVTVDFEGPSSSTLSRTPQLRFSTYKSKNVLSFSFENPIEKVTVGGPIKTLPERFPDMIAAYRINGKLGFIKTAGLLRELRYQSDKARSIVGYGVTIMSVVNTGTRDKLKFQGVMGTGVAQYVKGASGLNYDAIYNGTNELEGLLIRGGNIAYQHFWKSNMYSSLIASWLEVMDNSNLGGGDFKVGYYGAINLFWDAAKDLNFGWEAVLGERKNMNGDTGSALRLQMSATYKFSKSFK